MLIYWENLSSSFLLDVKSYIYLREKLKAHENDQNAFSTIDQNHTSNDCNCTSILTIYSTSTWHKSNQEKKRVTQYNHTLSSHRLHLSFIIYFSARWMTIIKQKNTIFCATIMSIMNVKNSSSRSKIETSLYRVSSMKSRARTMNCRWTAQTLSSRVYLSVTCWIETIDSLLILLFQFYCFNDVKLLYSRRAIFFLREFCSFDTNSIVFFMSQA